MLKQFTNTLINIAKSNKQQLKQQQNKLNKPFITIYHNNQSIVSHNLLKNLESYSLLPCTQYKQQQFINPNNYHNNNENSYETIKSSFLPTSNANSLSSSSSTTSSSSSKDKNSLKFNIEIKNNSNLSKDDYDFIVKNCLDIHPENNLIMLKLLTNTTIDNQLQSSPQQQSPQKLLKNFELLDKLYNYENFINLKLNQPLIIDYQNKLLGNCDSSFNRIIINYLNCGIQNLSLFNHNNTTTNNYKRSKNNDGLSIGNSNSNSVQLTN
ncbi:uncharacterized protein KGF55_005174 [Candida pseudojiufengensis]|uniref:uncharacterized protein n=1 Tax=Candida pseudojiufengensis TaxID=497109 RepID=UPI0022249DA0|nr:uncharacterized protein KGF55_005174 [Candida pseudojiufengensis]KAI5959942.1 hypothetical protein KGF55_005174 [Candida pseudojiufengensis]